METTNFTNLTTWWLSRYKPATQETYKFYLPKWLDWLAERGVRPMEASRVDIELWLSEIDNGSKAESTVAAHYDTVAGLYRFLEREELIDRNPCQRVARPKVHYELQRREVLTVLEYAAYLSAARRLGPTYHAIAVLGGMLGLRASEMAGLSIESFSSLRGYTVITFMGKGDKPARMPLPIPALKAIQDVMGNRQSGSLLQTQNGGSMDRRSMHRYVARTARVAGIARPISPHALRRTAATTGLAQGIPLRDIQLLLRHARSETTLRSYDMGEGIESHASHRIAAFLAGFSI